MQRPQIWHYGLVARLWAEFVTEVGPEAAYYKKVIETYGQPALDLGCGSGRLLFPFLQAGLEVDGCDYSEDMVAVCQERAEREGLSPGLYAQAMHELDLPRRYRTIYACDVIGLGGERRLTMQAMQRCYEHLRPGACSHSIVRRDGTIRPLGCRGCLSTGGLYPKNGRNPASASSWPTARSWKRLPGQWRSIP